MKKKKLFTLSAMLLFTAMMFGQVTRIGVLGFGFGAGAATLHIIEASYAPKPSYDLGVYANAGFGGDENNGSLGTGLGLQGKYYFLTGKFKPFVGAQTGIRVGFKTNTDSNGNVKDDGGLFFQAVPQAGFRIGPLNMWASYADNNIQGNLGFVFGFGKFKD
jgi:hypothetical protein